MVTVQECEANVETCRKNGNVEGEAIWLGALAARYRDSYDAIRALQYTNQSLQIFERLGNKQQIADTCERLAFTYKILVKDLSKAIEYQKRAVSLASGELKQTYEQELQNMLRQK